MDDDLVAALERRLRRVEDELAILRVLSTYGPAVDSGASDAAAALWTEDGVYDVGGVARPRGRDELSALWEGDQHQGFVARGSAHLTAAPVVTLDGDLATAVGYSVVCLRDGDGYEVWRIAANRWRLTRTPEGWRIVERYNRVLDGTAEPRSVLREAL